MKLRFSLKWLLAAMAYVAFALVAMLQQGEVWEHLLWQLNGLLLLLLGLVAIFYRGQPQALAIGFLLFFVANVATEKWASERGPAELAKIALGVGGRDFRLEVAEFRYRLGRTDPAQLVAETMERRRDYDRKLAMAEAIDALTRMSMGVLGAFLAGVVWRRAQRRPPVLKGE